MRLQCIPVQGQRLGQAEVLSETVPTFSALCHFRGLLHDVFPVYSQVLLQNCVVWGLERQLNG